MRATALHFLHDSGRFVVSLTGQRPPVWPARLAPRRMSFQDPHRLHAADSLCRPAAILLSAIYLGDEHESLWPH